jgi:cAMP-dependent protein kinase regulator
MYDYHGNELRQEGSEDYFDPPPPVISAVEADAEAAKIHSFVGSCVGGRRGSVSAAPVDARRFYEWQAPMHPKYPEHEMRIKEVIAQNDKLQVLFGHLSEKQLNRVVGAFFYRQVEAGDIIIQQGADGDFFYIVEGGHFDIFVQRRADLVPERVLQVGAGMAFGELALMYNVPRAATVRSNETGGLWCLDRESFQMMLVTTENSKSREYESFLRNVPLLSELTQYEVATVSDLLDSELFDFGECIVTQGETGDTFYFLYEGECRAYISGPQGDVEVMQYTQPGQYFGEVALVTNEPRRATVRASGPEGCVVLRLRREDVDLSVGSIQERLMRNIAAYPGYEAFAGYNCSYLAPQ